MTFSRKIQPFQKRKTIRVFGHAHEKTTPARRKVQLNAAAPVGNVIETRRDVHGVFLWMSHGGL